MNQQTALLRLCHVVSLLGVGGVERRFIEMLNEPTFWTYVHSTVVDLGRGANPYYGQESLRWPNSRYVPVGRAVKMLPKGQARVARFCAAMAVRFVQADVFLFWNSIPLRSQIDIVEKRNRCIIIYESGTVRRYIEEGALARRLSEVDALICNSKATARFLQLAWNPQTPTFVCSNPLLPSLQRTAEAMPPKTRSTAREFRIGMAGRLIPQKGMAAGIHLAMLLKQRGIDTAIHIAGVGPNKAPLEALSRRLGVSSLVKFWGLVRDISWFYQHVDMVLVPSLKEPFGLVSVEAQAFGCPVVVAHTDGLPETVAEGESGISVVPTLDESEYVQLGYSRVLGQVYSPAFDRIESAKAVDPVSFASAVEKVICTDGLYEKMSGAAKRYSAERFSMDTHIRRMVKVLQSVSRGQR